MQPATKRGLGRREFLYRGGRIALIGVAAPGLLAACGSDEDDPAGAAAGTSGQGSEADGTPIVGDVIDFALSSDEWEGAFGFVTLRLHPAAVDGKDAYFIRTDTSDRTLAEREGLVFAPKLEPLASNGVSGEMFWFDDDHPAVLSTEPGRGDYTPAWRVSQVEWGKEIDAKLPRRLGDLSHARSYAATFGELDVVVHSYRDPAGHRVLVYQADRTFPAADGAEHSSDDRTWTAAADGVVLFCADHPVPSLVVGDDVREVALAVRELGLR